jgi:chromosome segregation ATPase
MPPKQSYFQLFNEAGFAAVYEKLQGELKDLTQKYSDVNRWHGNQAEHICEQQREISILKTSVETGLKRIAAIKKTGQDFYHLVTRQRADLNQTISKLQNEVADALKETPDLKFQLENRDAQVKKQSRQIQALKIVVDTYASPYVSSACLAQPESIIRAYENGGN